MFVHRKICRLKNASKHDKVNRQFYLMNRRSIIWSLHAKALMFKQMCACNTIRSATSFRVNQGNFVF